MVTVEEAQVSLPTEVTLSYKVTVSPETQEIVKSGVVSLVILSVLEDPESVPVVISGVPGAASAVVSMIIVFWPAIDDAPPTVGRVSVALFKAASLMVPPFKVSELVAT